MKCRKIVNVNQLGKKMPLKTERQLEVSRRPSINISLIKNQFRKGYTPWIKGKRHSEKTKEKIRNNPNIMSFGFKDKHHTEDFKMKLSMLKSGLPCNPKSRDHLIKMLIVNHPMKNIQTAEKVANARRLKLSLDILEKVITDFTSGKSLTRISKDIKVDRIALTKLLRRNGIKIDAAERNRLDGLTNPSKIQNQFKKIQREVKNNEQTNIAISQPSDTLLVCN